MHGERFVRLVLACFVSLSFCLPGVLAEDIEVVVEDIEVLDLETRSVVGDYVVSEAGSGVEVGKSLFYIDRGYTPLTMSEEFEGATYISTAMDDEASKGDDFITFKVKVPVVVWIGTDARQGDPPKWVSEDEGWVEEPELFLQSIEGDTDFYILRRKEFPAGEIALGGNFDAPAVLAPMYVVFLTRGSGAAVEAADKLTTTWAELKNR